MITMVRSDRVSNRDWISRRSKSDRHHNQNKNGESAHPPDLIISSICPASTPIPQHRYATPASGSNCGAILSHAASTLASSASRSASCSAVVETLSLRKLAMMLLTP